MAAFIREKLRWKAGSYSTAVGIRYDELDRFNPNHDKLGIIYPLLDWKIEKEDILTYWKMMPFDLNIPEHEGNCVWCWKKSKRKLMTLAMTKPEVFEFPRAMEVAYARVGHGFDRGTETEDRTFFRGRCTVEDIFVEAATWPLSLSSMGTMSTTMTWMPQDRARKAAKCMPMRIGLT
jgi:formate-dependent nitrite reductase cytochrome c552 subunit